LGYGTILTRRSKIIKGRRIRISLTGRSDSLDRKNRYTLKEVSAS
jgi:hypothetical protein